MKNIKHTFSALSLLIALTMLIVVGCKRDLEDLEPATFPTTAEVYIDGFTAGLNYGAFGGSKVTAFDVDTEVKYRGSSSMKFAVPDAGDPEGAYAGGTYFTSVGRDLSGYDALTFWAKATKAATIDVVGFGIDFDESKYQTTLNGLAVNTNWKKYIIPIPDPAQLTQERGMFYYSEGPENGLGYTYWIDELKFEKLGTIAHPRHAILDGQDQVKSAQPGQQLSIGGLKSTFNMPTAVDLNVVPAAGYFTFSSSNPQVATVNSAGEISVLEEGTAVITAKVGELMALGSMTVNSGTSVGPLTAAPTPTRNPADVISVFSDAYMNVPGTDFNPPWGQATSVTQVPVAGNNTLRYGGLDYQGTQFGSNLDASGMTHLHLDFWTDNSSALNVYLISPGPEEKAFALSVPTNGWVGVDIPLSSFSPVDLSNLIQFKFDGDGDIYLDNLYFYKMASGGTDPTTAAPTPTFSAANVISVFSDAYSNIPGTNINPNWGQATQVSQVPVGGNNTMLYTGLNYQGIELGSSQNLSAMTHLHLDFWTANSTELKVFLISPGPAEKAYTLTVPTSGWTSIDIPLSEFGPVVNLADVIQFKFEGNGKIYLDNILFHN